MKKKKAPEISPADNVGSREEDAFLDWILAIGLGEAVRSRGKASKSNRRHHEVTR